ncbi:MAG TPA: ABC transporter permease, partial [Chitinophagaceae bacterium]|nr:ABC transporter permease [Chitinophagaceae bacterium]
MIKNYFKSAWNSLKRNRFFFSLNILGLAVGMATFLLVALYVRFERSYENFIPDKENIYRVKLDAWVNNKQVISTAENYPGVGPALKDYLPEVSGYARLYNAGYKNNVIITYQQAKPEPKAIKPKRFFYADSAFLSMMGYMLVKGNAQTALAEPMTAVISEKYAALYFGNEDPLGKTLVMQDDDFNHEQVKITGVFKDLPDNTHLKFDVLFAYKTLFGRGDEAHQRYDLNWQRNDMYTFVKLKDGTDPKAIEARLPAIINKHKPELKESGRKDILSLQHLTDIHLKSALAEEAESNGNDRIVMFMAIIGLFVLVIAWINYINLATARAVERSKEVGLRKVVGASKSQLVARFLIESALVNLLSIIVAFILVALALPYFNTISGHYFTSSSLGQPWFILTLVLLWIAGTFLSGFYPALVLSSFKPITVLTGKLKYSNQGNLLRKGLVVVQFAASIVLIGGTIIIYQQLNYMMHRDLGMNIDQVMVIDRPGVANADQQAFVASIDLFRNELKKTPSVTGVTTSMTVPGKQREYKPMIKMADGSDSVIVRANSMDYEFLDVFKMKLMAGRNFSPDRHADDRGVILTESAARSLGYDIVSDIIGQSVVIPQFGNSQRSVI